ncbi:TPA: hypothetical protein I7787_21750 [Vibrio vulnificus]|uniref:hypothetical protein n=1 Tax=Vibrio vulnificus TaxID=672 RepID=UPI001A2F38EE|nr:hypothetical protein [Vibrio vulnificus]EJX1093014.1 hypothetical protein [Vibrio vulnificus]ELH3492628.1 hypothetical protein [Vibrio vulnificus]MCA3928889.1 hypothetical protein [Vibrio vulnificus]HAS8618301.1 hypothetical protein [Vibrio vulnificus]
MSSLKEKIENNLVVYSLSLVVSSALLSGGVVSAGWAHWGLSSEKSEKKTFEILAKSAEAQLSKCESNLVKKDTSYQQCYKELAVLEAKLGNADNYCQTKLLEQQFSNAASDKSQENQLASLSKSNAQLLEKIEYYKTIESSCRNNVDVQTQINSVQDKYNSTNEYLSVALENHRINQKNIGLLTQECDPKDTADYFGYCTKLKQALSTKESYELQIASFREQLSNYSQRLNSLENKLNDL